MINYGKHTILKRDIEEVTKILKSNHLTTGPTIEKFEDSLINKFGGKYCTVLSNGSAALFLLGKALNWKKGDHVATTPISFIATANCIVSNNASPEFVDIDLKTYTIDPNKLEEKLKKKKLKAVIAVDYAGHPCDWESLKYLSNKYNFILINDACHSMGSEYNNNIKYAIKYAHFVTQSFHPVKAITTGEGGAIITNNKKISDKIKLIKNNSMIRNKNLDPWEYEIENHGMNYRISDIQCALGISQLKSLNNFIKKRRELAQIYHKELKFNDNFILPYEDKKVLHSYHLFPLQIKFDKMKITKKKMFHALLKKGIRLQVHYKPIHTQPFYEKNFQINRNELENSESFYKNEFSLPLFPSLKKNQLLKVIKELKIFR